MKQKKSYVTLSLISVMMDLVTSTLGIAQVTPVPDTRTTAPAAATQDEINAARKAGETDGNSPGAREGKERGLNDGMTYGKSEGYSDGYNTCMAQERKRVYDIGYVDGFKRGEYFGNQDGHKAGHNDGISKGTSDGREDGLNRSDRDAYSAATPAGIAAGEKDAESSDAAIKGEQAGLVDGDSEARRVARANDYQRGRKDMQARKFAEPIASTDEVSQRDGDKSGSQTAETKQLKTMSTLDSLLSSLSDTSGVTSHGKNVEPDYRYRVIVPRYRLPELNEAYSDGYTKGYRKGFFDGYKYYFDQNYDQYYAANFNLGCDKALSLNYRNDYDRGFITGEKVGYDKGFEIAYRYAFDEVYGDSFKSASAVAYQQSYKKNYDQYFEQARKNAYSRKYGEIFDRAHDAAFDKKYAEVYPKYAEQEYANGLKDELMDFNERPVRLLSAELQETIVNGLIEPSETIRVKVELRNFAETEINRNDVLISVDAEDQNGVVISIAKENPITDFKKRSVTKISGMLEIRLDESTVGKLKKFAVRATYKSKAVGDKVLSAVSKYATVISFAQNPVLREGFEAPIFIKVKNVSQADVKEAINISMRTNPQQVEMKKADVLIEGLAAGEEKIVEFSGIARTSGLMARIPFSVSSSLKDRRRIGSLEQSVDVPVLNDYKTELLSDASSLRKSGVIRLKYKIQNISSRFNQKSLQLFVKINGIQKNVHEVMGPNPQYLKPIRKGKTVGFVIPVMVKEDNAGGSIELEAKENGVTVVIHKVIF